MTKTYRTVEELVRIYRLAQSGASMSAIAQETGTPYSGVVSALESFKKYLSGKARGQERQSKQYREAVRQIRKDKRMEIRQPAQPIEPTDNLATLKESFGVFQRAITTFIERDVKTRHSALLEENERLRGQIEGLQKEVDRLRKSSLIDQLELELGEVRS